MKEEEIRISYQSFSHTDELNADDFKLYEAAKAIALKAYAPYSKFRVGVAIETEDQQIFTGNNQENASFSATICAERTVLSYVHANFPELKITKLAVYSPDSQFPLPPCGVCRQTILEYEKLQNLNISILLSGKDTSILKLSSSVVLLPLNFDSNFLDFD